MVKYTTDLLGRHTYWKLDRNRKRDQHSLLRQAYLLSRQERGLLPDYNACSFLELYAFGKDRHLNTSSERQKLIETLEIADEELTFERFLDLPPELRVLVYQFHFASLRALNDEAHRDLTDPRARLDTPPITQICRLIRHESLPFFVHNRMMDISLPFGTLAAKFIRNAPACAALVRNYSIRMRWNHRKPLREVNYKITWDRKKQQYDFELEVAERKGRYASNDIPQVVGELDEQVRGIFRVMGARKGGNRGMQMADFEALSRLVKEPESESWLGWAT